MHCWQEWRDRLQDRRPSQRWKDDSRSRGEEWDWKENLCQVKSNVPYGEKTTCDYKWVTGWGKIRGSQRDVVCLGWPPNSALVYEPKCGGRGVAGSLSQWVQLRTWSKNKLCRSNSIWWQKTLTKYPEWFLRNGIRLWVRSSTTKDTQQGWGDDTRLWVRSNRYCTKDP